jgi:hypothetical protein
MKADQIWVGGCYVSEKKTSFAKLQLGINAWID